MWQTEETSSVMIYFSCAQKYRKKIASNLCVDVKIRNQNRSIVKKIDWLINIKKFSSIQQREKRLFLTMTVFQTRQQTSITKITEQELNNS